MLQDFILRLMRQDPTYEYRLFNGGKQILHTRCLWGIVDYVINTRTEEMVYVVVQERVDALHSHSVEYTLSIATIVHYDFVESFVDWWLAHVFDLVMAIHKMPMTNTFAHASKTEMTRHRAWFLSDLKWIKKVLDEDFSQ